MVVGCPPHFWGPPGLVSSERSSLEFLLSRPGGGHVAVIAVGGPPESLDAHPGALRLQLLRRKGFVRIALQHGYGTPHHPITPPITPQTFPKPPRTPPLPYSPPLIP